MGPVIAGRLYGRAHRIAMQLRVPRPDGNVDQGDAALVRLPVDEVRDPNTNEVIQQAIPSGVQFLVNALRQAFGQMDQDLATAALESFFSLSKHGSKLSLSEFSVEFDSGYEEAHERAGLQLNDVAKYYLWFKGSGLPPRTIDDIKLQVNGDFRRFEDARALALRITPNKETRENEIFYGQDEDEWWYDAEEYDQYYETAADYDDYYTDEYDWWYGYEADGDGPGEWVYEYEDGNGYEWHEDDATWQSDGPNTTTSANVEPENTEASNTEAKYEEYYKGKSKGKGGNDGCFNCGSKWHLARDCPMAKGAGKKGGKGKGRGTWRWRAFLQRKRQGKVPQQGLRQELWQEGQRQEPLVHWNENPGPSRRHSGSHYFDFIVFAWHPLRQGQDPIECCRQDDTREACDPHFIRGRRLHVPEESQQGLRYIYDELYGWECLGRGDQAREAALLQLSDLPQHLHGWSILLCEGREKVWSADRPWSCFRTGGIRHPARAGRSMCEACRTSRRDGDRPRQGCPSQWHQWDH